MAEAARVESPREPGGWTLRRAGNAAVLVALLVVALALAGVVAPRLLGYRSFAITSASMGDAAPVGSLVLTREVSATEVTSGDVIAIRRAGRALVVHRIVSLERAEGSVTVRTKGDANRAPDAEPYVLPPRVSVMSHAIPLLGYLVGLLRMPLGWLLLIALPATAVALSTIRDLWATEERHGAATVDAEAVVPEPADAEVAELRVALQAARSEIDELRARLAGADAALEARPTPAPLVQPAPAPQPDGVSGHLLLVPGPTGYTLVEREGQPPQARDSLATTEGRLYVVASVGPRRCLVTAAGAPASSRRSKAYGADDR